MTSGRKHRAANMGTDGKGDVSCHKGSRKILVKERMR